MATTRRRMSYEFILYYGTAGAQASTAVENVRDTSYTLETEMVESTPRQGDGSYPITFDDPVAGKPGISWSMDDKDSDATKDALVAAARATPPTAVALRTVNKSGGTGVDGDFFLTVTQESPEKGKQGLTFEATPTDCEGRTPVLN